MERVCLHRPFLENNFTELIESAKLDTPVTIANHFSKLLDPEIFKSNNINGIIIVTFMESRSIADNHLIRIGVFTFLVITDRRVIANKMKVGVQNQWIIDCYLDLNGELLLMLPLAHLSIQPLVVTFPSWNDKQLKKDIGRKIPRI